ncbi:MAG TPA: hypothetical protein VFE62_08520 [Gemmataceae bacterium]|nr:hypothetical protein [Gemmataceae bacterium]
MIEKPFLLDPSFEKLVDSGAFRKRIYEQHSGMRARDRFVMLLFMNVPTIITFFLGLFVDRKIFIATGIWGGMIVLMCVFDLLNWSSSREKRQRMHRLAFDGDLVTGRIISCERKCYPGPAYKVEVRFAAMAPSGKEVQRTVAVERDDLLNAPLPPPGWPVLVLMVDETLYFML